MSEIKYESLPYRNITYYKNWYKQFNEDKIRLLQQALGVKAIGKFDELTLNAIFNYQEKNGYTKNGLLSISEINYLLEKTDTKQRSKDRIFKIKEENGEKKLRSYRYILESTKNTLNSIIKDRDQNTDLLVKQLDIVHSIFSDDTASKNYEKYFKNIQREAKNQAIKIQKEIDSGMFTDRQKEEIEKIIKKLNDISESEMESFNIITGAVNSYKNLDEYAKLGVKGA